LNGNLDTALKMIEQHYNIVKKDISHWLEYELFSWNWWVLFAFAIIPWIIWLKIVDRRILLEIILAGTLAIIPTTYLESIGVNLKFWIYPVKFLPFSLRALPFDMCIVPVAYMLLFQFLKRWKPYILALLIMALLFAFIGEPVSKSMNLVYYIRWKYYYSFFYYIALGLSIKFIVNRLRDTYLK
jgi:hypothetical protein